MSPLAQFMLSLSMDTGTEGQPDNIHTYIPYIACCLVKQGAFLLANMHTRILLEYARLFSHTKI